MRKHFLKIAVEENTKAKINILAAVKRMDIYRFIGDLVDVAWDDARHTGLVADAMLYPESVVARKDVNE